MKTSDKLLLGLLCIMVLMITALVVMARVL